MLAALSTSATSFIEGVVTLPGTTFGYSVISLKSFIIKRTGTALLLIISAIFSSCACNAADNNDVFVSANAYEPDCEPPIITISDSKVIAILLSHLLIAVLISTALDEPDDRSLSSQPWLSTTPALASLRILATSSSARVLSAAMPSISSLYKSIPSGVVSTGRPAKSLSMPIPSSSSKNFLKYQAR